MKELKLTGGARVGMFNASFPFATLKVNQDRLELKVSMIGKLIFQVSDIISIEPYTIIPLIGQGIKINHTVADYKQQVIFWTFKNPRALIRQIEATGFIGERDEFV